MAPDYRQYQKETWSARARAFDAADPLRAVIGGDSLNNRYFDKVTKRILRCTGALRSDQLVLEFGCGLGRLTSWLAERTDRVVGVDISLPMVQLAQKAAQRSGRRNLLYTVIDGTVLPFRPSSFELVICCGSLKYIIEEGDLKSVVKEFTRILSENGECVVIDEMDDRGPTMLTGKEDLTGWAVARRPEEYVQLFAEHRMRVRNHFMFYRNTLVSRYNALNQRLSCFKNSGPDRFVSEMIASWDAILDSALRRRLRAGRGWHVLHLVRGIM